MSLAKNVTEVVVATLNEGFFKSDRCYWLMQFIHNTSLLLLVPRRVAYNRHASVIIIHRRNTLTDLLRYLSETPN